jgi:hypothetical protein
MNPRYLEVLATIVGRLSNDNRGIQQHTDFFEVVTSLNEVLSVEDGDAPHYTEVMGELVKLGMSEGNARDVTLVYRALKVSELGPP